MDDHSRDSHDPTGDATGDEAEPHVPPPHRPGAAHLDATGPLDMDEILAEEPQRLPSRPVSAPPAADDGVPPAGPVAAGAFAAAGAVGSAPPTDPDATLVDGVGAGSDTTEVAGSPDPDATVVAGPADDADATVVAGPDAASPGDPDATVVAGADAETRIVDADATQIVPPDPDATRYVPPLPKRELDETVVAPAGDQWRAQGHAPVRPRPADEPTGDYRPVDSGRNWLLPVLLGLAGVVFIIGIAYALVVAARDSGSPAPSPTPTPTPPAASTPPPSPTEPSTSPSPSSSAPSQGPTGQAQLPDLTGRTLADAESILRALGLPFTEVPEVDDSHAPNTVTKMSPDPGLVDITTNVTLTYAIPSTTPSAPEPSTSPS